MSEYLAYLPNFCLNAAFKANFIVDHFNGERNKIYTYILHQQGMETKGKKNGTLVGTMSEFEDRT